MKLGIEVGIDINADFGCRRQPGALVYNTSEWYSYFYVDGTAVLSPGITLFSGFHSMDLEEDFIIICA